MKYLGLHCRGGVLEPIMVPLTGNNVFKYLSPSMNKDVHIWSQ